MPVVGQDVVVSVAVSMSTPGVFDLTRLRVTAPSKQVYTCAEHSVVTVVDEPSVV